MSQPTEKEVSKKPHKSRDKTKRKGDKSKTKSEKKPVVEEKPKDFEKTGGGSAVVPVIASSELTFEKELGTGCFGTVFLGLKSFHLCVILLTNSHHCLGNYHILSKNLNYSFIYVRCEYGFLTTIFYLFYVENFFFSYYFLAKCRGKHVAVKKLHAQEMDEQALAEFKREVGFLT